MTASVTWLSVLRNASQRLSAAGVEGAMRDARLLLADVLSTDRAGLIVVEAGPADAAALARFELALARRINGEPVSRIRGRRDFFGRTFEISPDVLDPRPETELLVEEGLKRLPPGGRVLDLGTGSGCILVSILAERPDATGVGIDLSPAALAVAARNAGSLGVADRAVFRQGSWDTEAGDGPFDLVVSNPPYIPAGDIPGLDREVRDFDPHLALDGGPDGLAPYRAISLAAPRLLADGGWLAVEAGAGQGPRVEALMATAGLTGLLRVKDLAGHERVTVGRTPVKSC